jgi:hypothetical protein
MKIEDILMIAGKAYRRRAEVEQHIENGPGVFPKGNDDLFYAVELAQCDHLLASARALLVNHVLELSFDADGRALASTPSAISEEGFKDEIHKEIE